MGNELWLWVKSGFLALFIMGIGFSFFAFSIWLLALVLGGLK